MHGLVGHGMSYHMPKGPMGPCGMAAAASCTSYASLLARGGQLLALVTLVWHALAYGPKGPAASMRQQPLLLACKQAALRFLGGGCCYAAAIIRAMG